MKAGTIYMQLLYTWKQSQRMLLFYLKYILSKRRAYYVKKKKKLIKAVIVGPFTFVLLYHKIHMAFTFFFYPLQFVGRVLTPFTPQHVYASSLYCSLHPFPMILTQKLLLIWFSIWNSNMCNICCDRKVKKSLVWTTSYVINQL